MVILLAAYALMWVGGVVSQVRPEGAPAQPPWAAPAFLLLAGVVVVVTSRGRELALLPAASLIGLAAEVVGVRYGFLFGDYAYTGALGPQLSGAPLVMASAWMVLVAYVRQMLMRLGPPAWAEAAIAAAWMTAIDLVIDPLAAGTLGYWRWGAGGVYYGVPARNFAGWFAVSLLIFGTVGVLFGRGRRSNPYVCLIGLSIILFFTAIALAHGLTLAGSIGVSLCAAHLAPSTLPAGRGASETNRW